MKRREFITPLGGAASKTNATKQKEELPNKDDPGTPPIDFWDDAVKRLIRGAKKRGYVTHDQINALLPSQEVKSEQIEDILAMFSEMGVNAVETEETEREETPEDVKEEPGGEESDGEITEVQRSTPAETKKSESGERTDDPVRMYLREMGSVALLSRDGEIAIAKRIEAGREAMIAGLCESPLTFQAIIIVGAAGAVVWGGCDPAPLSGGCRGRFAPSPRPCLANRTQPIRWKANSTKMISKTPSHLRPSRLNSSPRCLRPSTTSPTDTSTAPPAGSGRQEQAEEPVAVASPGAQAQEAQERAIAGRYGRRALGVRDRIGGFQVDDVARALPSLSSSRQRSSLR
jgi:hypothetical protein